MLWKPIGGELAGYPPMTPLWHRRIARGASRARAQTPCKEYNINPTSSTSKVKILKEEEVIEVSSSFEESQEEESSNFSELELEQVLEVAPYLNREILIEEDIKVFLAYSTEILRFNLSSDLIKI